MAKTEKFSVNIAATTTGKGQQRMKHQEDVKRTEREFQVGGFVYKLPFKYYGPFKVLQRVGAVAYKLELL
jgi:hypothetical protein